MRGRTACVLALILLVPSAQQIASAQSGRSLAWDEDPSSSVTGFAITVDGVRTDLGLTPEPSGGSCSCSTLLPFSSGRHSVVISAYNADGETPSAPLIVGPTANAGGPYSGQAGTALSVSGAGSTDTGGTIVTYTWAWGDATANTSSSSPAASHTYANSGTFTITLTVIDNYSASHSATSSATITTTPPAPPPPSSSVAVDYSGTTFKLIDPGTSVTLSTLTVGTGSNEALYAGLSTQGATLGSPSCSWDGQAMTNIGGQTLSDNSSVYVYRLVAPHSGNKSLTCQWSNSVTVMLGAFSVSGVNQTTPERNIVTSSGFSASPSISISSTSGDMSFAVGVNGGADWTSSSQAVVWLDTSGVAWNGAASRAAGTSSNTHGFTIGGGYSLLWGLIGLDIVAASNSAPPPPPPSATPTITLLNPTSGIAGTSVTITGTNFGATRGTSTVTFNGTAAAPTSWSATSVVVPVPASATTGNVVVTVGGQASNAVPFTVSPTPPPPPSSAVAVDYSGTTFKLIDPGTSVTLSTLTVGTGSNEALYAGLSTQGATLGSPSCSWDGQAMTNIGGQTLSDNSSVYVYRLVAPHPGSKSLTCHWSNTVTVMLGAFSVSGVNQTTPERNIVTSSGFSASPSISISSASGDMSFAVGVNGGADWTSSSQTVVWLDTTGVAWNGAASRAAGTSSNTHGFTIVEGYSLLWGLIGLDIVAAP